MSSQMMAATSNRVYDHIIIGAGIVGSWTGLHLAKAGKNVLLIEQFKLPHSRGSSHGHTRIFRITDPNPHMARLAWGSKPDWLELQKGAGGDGSLWNRSGRLITRPKEQLQWLDQAHKVMDDLKVPHERLSGPEINSKFHQMNWDGFHGIYEPDSAILSADKCLQAVQQAFVALGGSLLDGSQVTAIDPGSVIIKVHLGEAREPVTSKSLIVTGGAWNKSLLAGLALDIPLHAEAIAVCYWKVKKPGVHDLKNDFPNFSSKTGNLCIYGLPATEYPGMIKVCVHGGHKCDPTERDRTDVSESIRLVSRFLSNHFPLVDSSSPAIVEKCMYTQTPDDLFVYDRHPEHPNVVYGAGFCGGGFKVSPCSGRILAHLATHDPSFIAPIGPQLNLEYFSAARFGDKKAKL